MKILILNWRDIKHPLSGGAEISTHEHAKRWVNEGHEVIQISSSWNTLKKNEVVDGIRIIRFGNYYTVHLYAFMYYHLYLRKEINLIIDEFHGIPFFTSLYARCKKLAFIHETAEEIWFKNIMFPLNIIGYVIEPYIFKLYRNIPFMTVSQSTKNDLIRFGIKKENVHIIHNGTLQIKVKAEKEKKPTILYLGRLTEDKGTKDAIVAFSYIKQKKQDAILWIVGKEEKKGYKKYLENLIDHLQLSKHVIFYDHVTEEEKYHILKRSW